MRDEPVLRLEEAVRKMTSFPAQRFRLFDRGVLRPGLRADVVVFDLERVHDRATNLYPHSYPFDNIPHRLSRRASTGSSSTARRSMEEGEHTGALPGRVLRRG